MRPRTKIKQREEVLALFDTYKPLVINDVAKQVGVARAYVRRICIENMLAGLYEEIRGPKRTPFRYRKLEVPRPPLAESPEEYCSNKCSTSHLQGIWR